MSWQLTTIVVAAVAAGVNAGAFFAFSNFVMPALAELPPRDGAAAMQSINRFAPSPLFVAAIIGAGVIAVPVVIAEWDSSATGQFRWLLAGVMLSLLSFVITMAANVPRNNALDTVDQTALVELWNDYLVTWTRWNTARTVTSALSVAAFVLSARGR